MHVLFQRRLIFVHIPKTSGTSIATALGCPMDGPVTLAHLNPEQIRKYVLQAGLDEFHTFSVVRNPWDRYLSLYKYQRSAYYASSNGLNHAHKLATTFTFNEWMNYNIDAAYKATWFGVPQYKWWKDVSEVHQMEKLDNLRSSISSRYGIEMDLRVLNKSPEPDSIQRLSSRSIDYIMTLEKETVERFGYEPPAYSIDKL